MRIHLTFMLIAVMVAAAGTACGSGSGSDAAPTMPATSVVATPVSPPIAAVSSPTSVLTPAAALQTTGLLVYLRGKDLYVGDLATGTEQQLTSGSLRAGYAGYARADGKLWLYYTSLTAITSEPDGEHNGTFEVDRRQLGGAPDPIFTFEGNGKNIEFSGTNASVAPDGLHMAFSDAAGLKIRDIAAGVDTAVLVNGHCAPQVAASSPCHGSYFAPQWSPHEDWLFVQRILYEGAVGVLVSHPATSPNVVELKVGGLLASWSSDGVKVCMADNGMQPGAAGLVDPNDGVFHDLYPRIPDSGLPAPRPDRLYPSVCAWNVAGSLAVQYFTSSDREATTIAVFAKMGRFDRSIALPRPLQVSAWLPDASGFLLSKYDAPARRNFTSAILLDGTYRRLPFDAERVLGTIPAP